MIKPTEREIVKEVVKEELEFLRGGLIGVGEAYHNILRSYTRDRGLEALKILYRYIKEDVWPIFVEKRSKLSFLFPYIASSEVGILNELTKRIEKIGVMLKEIEKIGRKVFYPEEVSEILSYTQSLRIYMDYVTGRDYLTYEILDGKKVKEVLERFRPTIEAFERKLIKNNNSITFYMGSSIEYAFLNLFIIDAYDNSLLRMLIKEKEEKEMENILKMYSPSQGLNQILFSTEEKMKEYTRKVLRERMERRDLCLPRSLAQRVRIVDSGSKLFSYIQEIYGKEYGKDNRTPYII